MFNRLHVIFPGLVLITIISFPVYGNPPEWWNKPEDELIKQTGALYGIGCSELKPDEDITRSIAYANAAKDSVHFYGTTLKLTKNYMEKHQDFLVSKSIVNTPFCKFIMKEFIEKQEVNLSITVKIEQIQDENIKIFVQEYTDNTDKTLYVQMLLAPALKDYLIAVSSGINVLSAKATLMKENLKIEKALKGEGKIWKGANIRLFMEDDRKTSTLFCKNIDLGKTWSESFPEGKATLTDKQVEKHFKYNKKKKCWQKVK